MAAVVAPCQPHAFEATLPSCARDQLDEVFAASQARAKQWHAESAQAVQLQLKQGAEELRRDRSLLDGLRADLQGAQQLTEAARRTKLEGLRLADAMRQSAEALAHKTEVTLSTRDKLREMQRAQEIELRREEQQLAESRRLAEVQQAEIEAVLGLYRERLGLGVERVAPGTVRFSFTLLDAEQPSREFVLVLGTSERQGYFAPECSPRVPQLPALLERLNDAADSQTALPVFLCKMRRAFKEVAQWR